MDMNLTRRAFFGGAAAWAVWPNNLFGAPGKDGPVISDSGNLIADAKFAPIDDPDKLARDLEHIVGIVGHGLFVGMATKVILADAEKGLVEF